jgi:hypothetical protein
MSPKLDKKLIISFEPAELVLSCILHNSLVTCLSPDNIPTLVGTGDIQRMTLPTDLRRALSRGDPSQSTWRLLEVQEYQHVTHAGSQSSLATTASPPAVGV